MRKNMQYFEFMNYWHNTSHNFENQNDDVCDTQKYVAREFNNSPDDQSEKRFSFVSVYSHKIHSYNFLNVTVKFRID